MSKLRIISLIILIAAVFISVDLGFNCLSAVTAGISGTADGITICGIFAPIFLGDRLWSYEKYLSIFQTSAWISFAVLIENTVLAILNLVHYEKQGR